VFPSESSSFWHCSYPAYDAGIVSKPQSQVKYPPDIQREFSFSKRTKKIAPARKISDNFRSYLPAQPGVS
jgi:hypothetical protein